MKSSSSWWVLVALLALGLNLGCSSGAATGSGGSPGPGGSGGIGGDGGVTGLCSSSLVSSEPIVSLDPSIAMWRVVYTSESIGGNPIEVSGIVATAAELSSDEARDVVTFAHGTTGLFDPCAPSVNPAYYFFLELMPELVDAGYVTVMSDYEGLGSPGTHPYYVGVREGRGVVDIVCAAQQVEGVRASNRAVIWGTSQGGHAALFAGEIAPTYEPNMEWLGVVSAAPGSELVETFDSGAPDAPDARGYLWMMTIGLEVGYPELNIEDVYTAEALAVINDLIDREACAGEFLTAGRDFENAGFATNPLDLPNWPEVLEENSPGIVRSEMPVLVLQGLEDMVVPFRFTDLLFDRMCETGTQTDYRRFEEGTHRVLIQNLPAALEWTAERFAGEAGVDSCGD